MDFTWTNVWTVATTTGIFTAILNLGASWLREFLTNKSRKKSEATYLAMQLAIILEEFVVKCRYKILSDEYELERCAIELGDNLPALACYPQDSDWKSLDPKLAEQVLAFRNDVESANMSCQFESWHENNRVGSVGAATVVGDKASKLAQYLRKKYKLEYRNNDAALFFEQRLAKI